MKKKMTDKEVNPAAERMAYARLHKRPSPSSAHPSMNRVKQQCGMGKKRGY